MIYDIIKSNGYFLILRDEPITFLDHFYHGPTDSIHRAEQLEDDSVNQFGRDQVTKIVAHLPVEAMAPLINLDFLPHYYKIGDKIAWKSNPSITKEIDDPYGDYSDWVLIGSPKNPIQFDTKDRYAGGWYSNSDDEPELVNETMTAEDGRTVWVGEYIFE